MPPIMPAGEASPAVVSKTGEELPTTPYYSEARLEAAQAAQITKQELAEDRAIVVTALRARGYTYREIAEETGLSLAQIQVATRRARMAGQLRETLDMVDHDAVPQAVDNLVTALRDPDHERWWEATTEVLHGRGVLQRHSRTQDTRDPATGVPPLQINILAPEGGTFPTVIVNSPRGAILGNPNPPALPPAEEGSDAD